MRSSVRSQSMVWMSWLCSKGRPVFQTPPCISADRKTDLYVDRVGIVTPAALAEVWSLGFHIVNMDLVHFDVDAFAPP